MALNTILISGDIVVYLSSRFFLFRGSICNEPANTPVPKPLCFPTERSTHAKDLVQRHINHLIADGRANVTDLLQDLGAKPESAGGTRILWRGMCTNDGMVVKYYVEPD